MPRCGGRAPERGDIRGKDRPAAPRPAAQASAVIMGARAGAPMFTNLPPVTKALLIANCAVFALQLLFGSALDPLMLWPWLPSELAPYAPQGFMPWQLLTHGFMHSPSNIAHLLFNMLALLMFGAQLEYTWGQRRFLTYFLVCVVGAGLCQLAVVSWGVRNGGG